MRCIVLGLWLGGCHHVFGVEPEPATDASLPHGQWTAVSAGENFTCGLRDGGALYCWGRNDSGKLGVNLDDPQVGTPRRVNLEATWKQIAAGEHHACAIQSDDTLWCWGDNSSAQLGVAIGDSIERPQQVGTEAWSAVACGDAHTCGIRLDGALLCWGRNDDGQLGDGTQLERTVPTLISGPASGWTHVVAGSDHTCALDAEGNRWCWGAGTSGQLGDGTYADRLTPAMLDSETWGSLDAGGDTTCGILTDGRARCWGENYAGQVGDGSTGNERETPQPIGGGFTDWVELAVAGSHTCGRRADGSTWCWGDPAATPLEQAASMPTRLDDSTGWIAIATNQAQTCRLGADQNLWCAGNAATGQLGNNATASNVPLQVDGTWTQIDTGSRISCGVSAGAVRCWGDNRYGAVGDGTRRRALVPVPLAGMAGTEVSVGRNHVCARTPTTGAVQCWGVNHNGSLGTGTSQANAPVALANPFAQLSAGDHTCGIDGTSQLFCWGTNDHGQLGIGTMTTSAAPAKVGNLTWSVVSAHEEHTCGIELVSKATKCWGWNDRGQLGDGSTTDRAVPTLVSQAFIDVWAGANHTCGRTADVPGGIGSPVSCWGRNSSGQLGDSSTDDRRTPVKVTGERPFTQVSLGNHHTCGVSLGKLYCWGSGYFGQLGVGDFDDRRAPTQVGSDDWKVVAAGDRHTCALRADDAVFCWGDSSEGALGTLAVWSKAFVPVSDP